MVKENLRMQFFLWMLLWVRVLPEEGILPDNQNMLQTLPDVFTFSNGKRVDGLFAWEKRQKEILDLFKEHVYGRVPPNPHLYYDHEIEKLYPGAMNGMATLKVVRIIVSSDYADYSFRFLMFIPNKFKKPLPVFLFLCNRNPAQHLDETREKQTEFWPAELLVENGFIAAAVFNGDIAPDKKEDQCRTGVFRVFEEGQSRSPNAWGTIGAWAWGISRIVDYLTWDRNVVDSQKIAVVGHSRGGKAALWAGAQDERISLVISNNSGCTGAALARRRKGETIAKINESFPHWFCENYKKFNDREDALPVDQHMLIACIAPRAVYIASASEDAWADPEGEFLAWKQAFPVWKLWDHLREQPLEIPETMPSVNQVIHRIPLGYHLRGGKHDLTKWDWIQYINFAKQLYRLEQ